MIWAYLALTSVGSYFRSISANGIYWLKPRDVFLEEVGRERGKGEEGFSTEREHGGDTKYIQFCNHFRLDGVAMGKTLFFG